MARSLFRKIEPVRLGEEIHREFDRPHAAASGIPTDI